MNTIRLIAGIVLLGSVGLMYLPDSGGGGNRPDPATDSLAQAHANDRATQVKILRDYVTRTFPSDAAAQEWLNARRLESRPDDWISYTDELGTACATGVDAVAEFADKLEAAQ
jgi:hypothetical protein